MTDSFNSRSPRLSKQLAAHPNEFLDAMRQLLQLKSDAALARMVGVKYPVISKIRHRRLPVGATILMRLLEMTDLSLRDFLRLTLERVPNEAGHKDEASNRYGTQVNS